MTAARLPRQVFAMGSVGMALAAPINALGRGLFFVDYPTATP
jgi:hypothetical protein